MPVLSRRNFIASGAALATIPLPAWVHQAHAQPATVLTRFEATSPQGQGMLEKYARAVAKMMAQTPEASPLSWLFQWYTHSVDPTKGMAAEVARLYSGAPPNDPSRLLALATWNTCQPHQANGLPQQQRMFLPWHRMYVYLFERIIQKQLNDATFTLPYWDYTTDGKKAIPEQFRRPNDPLYKVLFRANRNDGSIPGTANVNGGQPIDQDADAPLNLDALARRDFDIKGVALGFSADVERGIHGDVHVLVGNTSNMGSVPWAARDPIFWLHHCNIDRMWWSWNKAGRKNPTSTSWLDQSFAFANENSSRVDPVNRDFVEPEAIEDGAYTYDQPVPVPPLSPTPAGAMVAAFAPSIIAQQAQPGPVNLSGAAVSVPLTTTAAVPMSAQIAAGGQNQRVFLVLQNLQAHAQPGIRYNVYLDPPSGAPSGPASGPVGAINFFDAVGHGEHGGMVQSDKFYSFDVTDRVTGAAAGNGTPPTVRIAPAGAAAADARPAVGSVALVRQ
ncbi:tyrosinase family protein [Nitrobacter vulgaris]|nr:tyrosinase family protein [Nitrobacter vulgaris]